MFWLKHKSKPYKYDHIIGVKYHTTELTAQYDELTNSTWCDCFEQAAYLCNMAATPGMNCIKIGLPGKLILRDYFQENMTS